MKPADIKTGKIYHMVVPGGNENIPIDDICVVYSVGEDCEVKVMSKEGEINNRRISHHCIDRVVHHKEAKKFKKKALKAAHKKIDREIKIWFQSTPDVVA